MVLVLVDIAVPFLSFHHEFVVTKSDNKYSVTITRKGDSMEMTASDAAGNVLFDGPIDTDEQWKAVPPEVEPIARKMVADMKTFKAGRGTVVLPKVP